MNAVAALLAEIDAFLARHGMAETRFGRDAMNDAHFVSRLRKGGSTTLRTVEKLNCFMAARDQAASQPQKAAA